MCKNQISAQYKVEVRIVGLGGSALTMVVKGRWGGGGRES